MKIFLYLKIVIYIIKDKFVLSDDIVSYINSYNIIYEKLPKQIIHRDMHPNNILFINKKVVGFIDFEISVKSIRILDICYCLTAILSESFNEGEKWLNYIKPLISGYQSINKLTNDELDSIVLCLLLIEFIFTGYFISVENDKLALLNYDILKWIYESRDYIKL